ncbi:MAG: helix-turn-helix transcriptional regulator [Candidatus Aenigmarchaeota archaeon]|nr:helix-turn-helix transcriptional regulator [Candidatus Aenigmarchaeota archaeon]
MPVKSSDEIIRKARELDMMRRLGQNASAQSPDIKEIQKSLRIIEMRMDMINRKLDKLIEEKMSVELKDAHRRILNLLNTWMSTENLARALGYSQEYTSRKVSDLKSMGKIQERREGKNIYYKIAD